MREENERKTGNQTGTGDAGNQGSAPSPTAPHNAGVSGGHSMTPEEARAILQRDTEAATEKVKAYLHWRVQYRLIRGTVDTMPEDFFTNLHACQELRGKGD